MWRDRPILLPDGRKAYTFGIRRSRIVWTLDAGRLLGFWDSDDVWRWGVLPVEEVRVYKDPAAVLLGSCKRGVLERPSKRKKAACRHNGRMPVRPGRRPRGRPTQNR